MAQWWERLGALEIARREELKNLREKYEQENPDVDFPRGYKRSDFHKFESLFPELRTVDETKQQLPPQPQSSVSSSGLSWLQDSRLDPSRTQDVVVPQRLGNLPLKGRGRKVVNQGIGKDAGAVIGTFQPPFTKVKAPTGATEGVTAPFPGAEEASDIAKALERNRELENIRALKDAARLRGETHFWYEPKKAWALINTPDDVVLDGPKEVPLSRMPFTEPWDRDIELPGVAGEVSREIRRAVVAPLFNIAGVPISSSDIVAVVALGFGAYHGIRSLTPLFKELPDRVLQRVLNLGVDKWIARMSRGVPPQHAKAVQNFLYGLVAKNRIWLQQRATESWLRRQAEAKATGTGTGTGTGTAKARTQTVEDTINDIKSVIIPRGTQTGAMATGGIGKPAQVIKVLPSAFDTRLLQSAQAQGKQRGLDVEAIGGIAGGEYWVSISTSTLKGSNAFHDWVLSLSKENFENGQKIKGLLAGKFPGESGGKRFIPFKNISDAERFLTTGDTSLIAKTIYQRGVPWTPAKLAETMEAIQQDAARRGVGSTSPGAVSQPAAEVTTTPSPEPVTPVVTPEVAPTPATEPVVTPPVEPVAGVPAVSPRVEVGETEPIALQAFNKMKATQGWGGRTSLTSTEVEALRIYINKHGELDDKFLGIAEVIWTGETEIIIGVFPDEISTLGGRDITGGKYIVYNPKNNTFGTHSTSPASRAASFKARRTGETVRGQLSAAEFQSGVKDWLAGKVPFPSAEEPLALPPPVEAVPQVPGEPEVAPAVEPVAGVSEVPAEQQVAKLAEQVKAKLEAVKPPIKRTIINELQDQATILETEIKANQAALKGVRGEEARVGRETIKGLERELAFARRTLDNFKKRTDLPDATVLRRAIMATARFKGLPKGQLQDIFWSVAGKRQLRSTQQEHLTEILKNVKTARPVRIKEKQVVTRKTEKKIDALRTALIKDNKLTDGGFNELVASLGLPATKFENAFKFITEGEAKSLIAAMNDEAILAEETIRIDKALDLNPDVKVLRDNLNVRSGGTTDVEFDGNPITIRRGNELRSFRYYVLKLQKELNAPIYDIWQRINMAHLANRAKYQTLIDKLEDSTTEFKEIVGNPESLQRVEDYIASKREISPVKSPAEITESEIALANELERQLFEWRNPIRYARFMEAYSGHAGDVAAIGRDISDAKKWAIRRAVDVYESQGATGLRKFLDTQEWGVIRSGYTPESVVKPKLELSKAPATSFQKGHIRTRTGTEFNNEDRDIIQRYGTYARQILALTEMSPLVRAFDRVYTDAATKLTTGTERSVSSALSRGLNEMKGYKEDANVLIHAIERLYGQVAATVFWRPDLALRNKFQNFAFNPDFHAGLFLHPGNKPLSAQRRAWFEIFVAQQKGIEQDFLLRSQASIPGFGRLTELANKISLYPWSDKSNRAEAYFVRMNKVDRALAQYNKDDNLNALVKNSGLSDFEPRQQAEALELLVQPAVDYGLGEIVGGHEAFARYNAQQLINNVHFLYDRAQRAPAEQGASGKTLGNLLVFQRSFWERLLLQGGKLDPKSGATAREKVLAARIIVGILVGGLITGETYKKITGKKFNPYNPLNMLSWSPGGLSVGVVNDIVNVSYLITRTVMGDETSLSQIPGKLSQVADVTLPFYRNLILALDSVMNRKNVDVLLYKHALRKIRELLDAEYEVRGGVHEIERNLVEKLQHALFGGEKQPDTTQEVLKAEEKLLGQPVIEDAKPYHIAEPDYHDMKDLNTAYGRKLKNVDRQEITTENGYSDKAVAWASKEAMKEVYDTLPNVPYYKINADTSEGDTFEEYYQQWHNLTLEEREEQGLDKAYLGNFSMRTLELLRQYHSAELARAEETNNPFADKEGQAQMLEYQAQMLEDHPELKEDARDEQLRSHPKENAQLALFGQAKFITRESYEEFNRLLKELDIPESAIPESILPSDGSSMRDYYEEDYFLIRDYFDLPSQPPSVRQDARRRDRNLDAALVKWHEYTPITGKRTGRDIRDIVRGTATKPTGKLTGRDIVRASNEGR